MLESFATGFGSQWQITWFKLDLSIHQINYRMATTQGVWKFMLELEEGPDMTCYHFPNLYERCLKYGVDITRDRVPVVPAAPNEIARTARSRFAVSLGSCQLAC